MKLRLYYWTHDKQIINATKSIKQLYIQLTRQPSDTPIAQSSRCHNIGVVCTICYLVAQFHHITSHGKGLVQRL